MSLHRTPPVPPMPGSLVSKPLKAVFSMYPHEVKAGAYVMLDASFSSGDVVEYSWELGDGSSFSGPANALPHRWRKAGTYDVTLKITDRKGNQSFHKHPIRIHPTPNSRTR